MFLTIDVGNMGSHLLGDRITEYRLTQNQISIYLTEISGELN